MRTSKGYLLRACCRKGVSHYYLCLAETQLATLNAVIKRYALIGGCWHWGGGAIGNIYPTRSETSYVNN